MPFPKLLLSYLLTFIVFFGYRFNLAGIYCQRFISKIPRWIFNESSELDGSNHILPAFHHRCFYFHHIARRRKKFIDIGNTARCTIRVFYLRHLRSNQSGNSQGLAAENCFH